MKLFTSSLHIELLRTSLFAAPQKGDVKFTPSDNKDFAVVWTYDSKIDDKFFPFVKNDLSKIGFYLNAPHHNVNTVYEQRELGKSVLSTLNFNSLFAEELVVPLIKKDPRIAAFSPFNLLMYRTLSEPDKTIVAHLTAETMLDILEIDDQEIRQQFVKGIAPLDKKIDETLGGKKSHIPLVGYAADTMMNMEIPFEEQEDVYDFMDDFQMKFESTFEKKGYIIAGYYNVKESFNSADDNLPTFTVFWSYDLCHIPFSYTIFDGKNAQPMAGTFAPCSIYLYVKKGENKIVIGMPTLAAWGAAMGIKNKEQLDEMNGLDQEITSILKSLGGVEVPNGNPLLRK
ncbi:MAG: hypothetical protein PF439_05825 [Helicobacteraceae bacterium]|jgi:uncharacterized protein (DUF302 family)|nr:hypothetical protein [Helicobacteraceae bacterium]